MPDRENTSAQRVRYLRADIADPDTVMIQSNIIEYNRIQVGYSQIHARYPHDAACSKKKRKNKKHSSAQRVSSYSGSKKHKCPASEYERMIANPDTVKIRTRYVRIIHDAGLIQA